APFTLITWWQLGAAINKAGSAVALAPGQDLTLTSLSLLLADLSRPLGDPLSLPTLALESLFKVPAGASLLLQDVVVTLSTIDLRAAIYSICSASNTSAFPYSSGAVVEGGVVRLIDHTSRAAGADGTAGAGGEVRWINVTLSCPGYGIEDPACAARPVTEGWELGAAALGPLLEATEGPVMLSLAPDVALPTDGSWEQVVVPAGRLMVLIGDPTLQQERGRRTTLDLGGVEAAWSDASLGSAAAGPDASVVGVAQLRDLQLVNLPYSSMPREPVGFLALSMQSFQIPGRLAQESTATLVAPVAQGPLQLRVSRCTLVVPDPELAFLARAASGLGQPDLTALFGDEAGQPRVGGEPAMDGAQGRLLLEFLQIRSLAAKIEAAEKTRDRLGSKAANGCDSVAFTEVTLVAASRYSGGLLGPAVSPQWPPLLIRDKDVALQWGATGTSVYAGLEEALLDLGSCGQVASNPTVRLLSSYDDRSVQPVTSGEQRLLLAESGRSSLQAAGSCVVAGYPPTMGAISRVSASSPITLRDMVLYNLAPGGVYPLPPASTNGSVRAALSPAPQLQGADAPWANSSLPLWYFQCA
ncbi:hypothetical protein TSOC_009890, partial [Tetrabaena socialis]